MITQLGWLAFTALLIVVVALYTKISRKLERLRRDITTLQIELEQHKDSTKMTSPTRAADESYAHDVAIENIITEDRITEDKITEDETINPKIHPVDTTSNSWPPSRPTTSLTNLTANTSDAEWLDNRPLITTKNKASATPIEPDERSLPIVTSLIHSIKNWFFGGNLVVRVGVLVLLVGVVLLLRLLSEYIEVSIAIKLMAIGIAGLGLAGLGLKLTAKRFSYGITLQGAGLAIAYLSTFFAYSVYQIISSIPSFIGLGLLSTITIVLAVRQNAFPLALLALSGGFFAPILTSEDTGSLVVLFSYYLLLNVTIAAIAHYRPWKILNLFGATVTFGLAYYWGTSENLSAVIESQRWLLVTLVALHLLLYLFVVIRYAQQIISYNTFNEAAFNADSHTINNTNDIGKTDQTKPLEAEATTYLFPIDTGLLFSVPLLAFGLFAALLDDIPNALTVTSAILATIYLVLGWGFVQRSQRYALMTEGMLALGFGFLALVIPLALNAEWIAFGWSVQGLALVWFGRRSLRSWSVLFGLLLQLISIGMLVTTVLFSSENYPVLALSISAISYLAATFILRASHSPALLASLLDDDVAHSATHNSKLSTTSEAIATYANALGISNQAARQWLVSINSQSHVFNLVWRSPRLVKFLTFTAMAWMLNVLVLDLRYWFDVWQLRTTVIALAALISLSAYWIINRYRPWVEVRQLSQGLLLLFYLMLVLQLPQKFELNLIWTTMQWLILSVLIVGWFMIGQLWLKTQSDNNDNNDNKNTASYAGASWLGTGLLLIAAAAHYGLPASDGVMAVLIPAVLILSGLWFSYRSIADRKQNRQVNEKPNQGLLHWFDWQSALFSCAVIFIPMALFWVVITNWSYDGVIWHLPYFPLLNLYDITSWLTLLVGFGLYYLSQKYHDEKLKPSNTNLKSQRLFTADNLLITLGLISFWLVSSMLIRTLHAFIGTPLWDNSQGGAWQSEQVQTGLTILWTLLALVATIMASRYWQRTLWFMGIGLLGIVVLKLVLVDLSQTEAIWRVISFLGAGSLILLIGYLAPLPPANEEAENQAKE
ncbi:DUF2339 domain-containing protein [Psychrobacter immobilis]|uniref:DUF2339 domain-containing protein n=1 Tax=Psychrobacter immobilis TaxID=498 RepID=UPI001D129BE4|nr:DUF2339 domain-containing protein [Psychrobacter immobilis]